MKFLILTCINYYAPLPLMRPLCSWLYHSWIYNYLCNQCLSPLKLWVRPPFMVKCTRYNIMWYSLSVVFSWYYGFLHLEYIVHLFFLISFNKLLKSLQYRSTLSLSCGAIYNKSTWMVWFVVFNTTFKNISVILWQSVLTSFWMLILYIEIFYSLQDLIKLIFI
jgi:hypothetical protein